MIFSLSKEPLRTVKVHTRRQGETEQVIAWLQEYGNGEAKAGEMAARASTEVSHGDIPTPGSQPSSPEVDRQILPAVIGCEPLSRPMLQNGEDSGEACGSGYKHDPFPRPVGQYNANLHEESLASGATPADSKHSANKARWTVLPMPNNGGEGSGNVGGQAPEKRLKFSLKKKGDGHSKRVKPSLPQAMVEAAAIADEEQDRLIAAAAAAAVAFKGSTSQPMDICSKPAAETGAPSPATTAMTAGLSRFGRSSTSRSSSTPATPAVFNEVRRVRLSCSKPLLTRNGTSSGNKLHNALRNNRRLIGMRWDGGLVFVNAAVTDAAGGKRLPAVNLTQSPTALIIEAMGAKISITAPPEAKNNDGFVAACEGEGVNSLKALKDQLEKLARFIERISIGGQESLMLIDNLSEMRLLLRQVGAIREEEFRFLPALGGIWLGIYHNPPTGKLSGVWKTGSLPPTIKFFVLMRRERLAYQGGLTVEENIEYAEDASAAAAAAAAAAAVKEINEKEVEDERYFRYVRAHPKEYLDAVKEKIQIERSVQKVVYEMVDAVHLMHAEAGLP